MIKPAWYPENPNVVGYTDEYGVFHRAPSQQYQGFDQGADAMLKAVMGRLEKLTFEMKLTAKEQDAILLAAERLKWEAG